MTSWCQYNDLSVLHIMSGTSWLRILLRQISHRRKYLHLKVKQHQSLKILAKILPVSCNSLEFGGYRLWGIVYFQSGSVEICLNSLCTHCKEVEGEETRTNMQ